MARDYFDWEKTHAHFFQKHVPTVHTHVSLSCEGTNKGQLKHKITIVTVFLKQHGAAMVGGQAFLLTLNERCDSQQIPGIC